MAIEVLLVANGAGPARAGAATDAGIEAFDARRHRQHGVLRRPVAGARNRRSGIATSVDRIVTGGQHLRLLHQLCKGPRYPGPIRSIPYVAQTAEEKRESGSEPAQSRWKWRLPEWRRSAAPVRFRSTVFVP